MPILTDRERLGTELAGRYQLESIVARGGMGVVYEAIHAWTGRRVAVKLVRSDGEDSAKNQRALNEARWATQLHHPNVVDVLDMGEDDGVLYVVMEYLEGESLASILAAGEPIEPGVLLAWMLPILGAVATAHDAGILHRDLKPSNLFMSRDGSGATVPKLLDFGIAKAANQTTLTASGIIVGTPHYMAPEQATDGEIAECTDIWALGVILHECLRGRRPFEANTSTAVLMKVVNDRAPRLSEVAPDVPPALSAVVDRALEPDRRKRFASARSFAHALLSAAMQDGVLVPLDPDPVGLPEWKRWRATLASDDTAGVEPTAIKGDASTASIRAVSSSKRDGKRRKGRYRLAAVAAASVAVAGGASWLVSRSAGDVAALSTSTAWPEPSHTSTSTRASIARDPPSRTESTTRESAPYRALPVREPESTVHQRAQGGANGTSRPAKAKKTKSPANTGPAVTTTPPPKQAAVPALVEEW